MINKIKESVKKKSAWWSYVKMSYVKMSYVKMS